MLQDMSILRMKGEASWQCWMWNILNWQVAKSVMNRRIVLFVLIFITIFIVIRLDFTNVYHAFFGYRVESEYPRRTSRYRSEGLYYSHFYYSARLSLCCPLNSVYYWVQVKEHIFHSKHILETILSRHLPSIAFCWCHV